jgi:hypothetical protein
MHYRESQTGVRKAEHSYVEIAAGPIPSLVLPRAVVQGFDMWEIGDAG